jgi:hypothetical protein
VIKKVPSQTKCDGSGARPLTELPKNSFQECFQMLYERGGQVPLTLKMYCVLALPGNKAYTLRIRVEWGINTVRRRIKNTKSYPSQKGTPAVSPKQQVTLEKI